MSFKHAGHVLDFKAERISILHIPTIDLYASTIRYCFSSFSELEHSKSMFLTIKHDIS